VHQSNLGLGKLAEEQERLSKEITIIELPRHEKKVAGVDVSYKLETACAAAVIIDKNMRLLEKSSLKTVVEFPYISSYLSYRELKPARKVVEKLGPFDVLFVNGHGLAHPRGFGLASHLGLVIGKPTIGVARKLLVGKPKFPKKESTPIIFENKIVGYKWKSPSGSSIYVSIGNLVTLEEAIRLTKKYTIKGPLPEPLRLAHIFANECQQAIMD
jgi:deoxyribonuclease V